MEDPLGEITVCFGYVNIPILEAVVLADAKYSSIIN